MDKRSRWYKRGQYSARRDQSSERETKVESGREKDVFILKILKNNGVSREGFILGFSKGLSYLGGSSAVPQ